jgi:hypothetical protein
MYDTERLMETKTSFKFGGMSKLILRICDATAEEILDRAVRDGLIKDGYVVVQFPGEAERRYSVQALKQACSKQQ